MNENIRIKAAVAFNKERPFTTTDLELKNPGPKEIRVKVVATGICHTDIMTKNKGLCQFPMVLGHEGVGIVDALGEEIEGFEIGDHVLMSYDSCGTCPQCEDHKPSYCDDHGSLNFAGTRPNGEKTHRSPESQTYDVYGSFFQQSSFATYALSHETNTFKVDKSLPLPMLAPLACGVQTGAGTVFNTLKVEEGKNLAVFGCGCVGLSSVMAARASKAKTIIAVDLNPKRLEMASELGATHTFNPSDYPEPIKLVEAIKELTSGGCHYAIDTTGIPPVLRQAFDSCGVLGTTAMIAPGVPGTEVSLEMMGLLPGKSIRGVIQGDSDSKTFIPKLIELWKEGQFPFDKLITTFRSIDEIETAVEAMSSGEVIKPVVIIDESYS